MAAVTTLPAAFVANTVLTAAQLNDLRGAFRILQVVAATPRSTATSSSTSTFVTTGLTATITPSSTTSKILCVVQQNGSGKETTNTWLRLRLYRAGSSIVEFESFGAFDNTTGNNYVGTVGTVYLDSPATIAATTYETFFCSGNNTGLAQVQANSSTSTMILMEVSA